MLEKKESKDSDKLFKQILANKKNNVQEKIHQGSEVKVIFSYDQAPKKRVASDFINYFNKRYSLIEKILKQRQELNNIISINRLLNKRDREQVSIIGIVKDKRYTKNDKNWIYKCTCK